MRAWEGKQERAAASVSCPPTHWPLAQTLSCTDTPGRPALALGAPCPQPHSGPAVVDAWHLRGPAWPRGSAVCVNCFIALADM